VMGRHRGVGTLSRGGRRVRPRTIKTGDDGRSAKTKSRRRLTHDHSLLRRPSWLR